MTAEDDLTITMEHAEMIAQRVVGADGKSRPLVGKEAKLLGVLVDAQFQHNDALSIDAFQRFMPSDVAKLKKALDKVLVAFNETSLNPAFLNTSSDGREIDPNSDRGLLGMIRQALSVLDEELPTILDRRDHLGIVPRSIRNHPENVSSVGLRAVAEVLREFWDIETASAFSDDFENSVDVPGKENWLVPKGLAAKFVYETAKLIDPRYTGEDCSYAMRQR